MQHVSRQSQRLKRRDARGHMFSSFVSVDYAKVVDEKGGVVMVSVKEVIMKFFGGPEPAFSSWEVGARYGRNLIALWRRCRKSHSRVENPSARSDGNKSCAMTIATYTQTKLHDRT